MYQVCKGNGSGQGEDKHRSTRLDAKMRQRLFAGCMAVPVGYLKIFRFPANQET